MVLSRLWHYTVHVPIPQRVVRQWHPHSIALCSHAATNATQSTSNYPQGVSLSISLQWWSGYTQHRSLAQAPETQRAASIHRFVDLGTT
ncbi:hypothetical protein Plhal304r1_c105g0175611 [Plasmopara halstedii]